MQIGFRVDTAAEVDGWPRDADGGYGFRDLVALRVVRSMLDAGLPSSRVRGALAALRGSQAHDEIRTDRRRDTNHAGGIEGGMSNGEEIVVRAAMKPLPTLMKPLASVDLATGEAASALVERSDVAAVEALAVVAEGAVAWELAVAARDKFGGDAIVDFVGAHAAYLDRIEWR